MHDLTPFGPHALRLALDDAWIDDIGGRIALSAALARVPGVLDVLVTEHAALVVCGSAPDATARTTLEVAIALELERCRGHAPPSSPRRTIDVLYDGPDLDTLATELSLTREELVARHTSQDLTVSFLGFAPGFAYLRGLDPVLARASRLPTPRPRVPRGAVAIAAGMSAIYPAASPGGWRLLGRAIDFDALAEPLAPGDRVRFRATVDEALEETIDATTPRTHHADHLVVEAVAGPALLVDGVAHRRLSRGTPAGGPLVEGPAHTALRAVGGGRDHVVLERYGAITLRSRAPRTRVLADELGRVITLREGDAVTLDPPREARVGYVAIEGGFSATSFLGGRGTMLSIARGGHQGRVLRRGDQLVVEDDDGGARLDLDRPRHATRARIHAHRGPDRVDDERVMVRARIALASDRTGTRLDPHVPHAMRTRPARTAPMTAGAIQAPPSGELIVLGPEHPVTGGYPIVGVLDRAARDHLFSMPLGSDVEIEIE